MSRQFTDGEIVAAVRALAAEGSPLTRASVRKRLGGGGSTRISATLKEYMAGAHGSPPRSGPPKVQSLRTDQSGPEQSGLAPGPAVASTSAPAKPTDVVSAASTAPVDLGPEGSVAHLESEIRVLKILLESERTARREDEARHSRTIEALQREIEIASRGRSERAVGRTDGPVNSRKPRSKTTS